MDNKVNISPFFVLLIMFGLMAGSAWNDSAIMDELAHIPAGYSYVTEFDYRLNPEHPPLFKALAGLSTWIFVNPRFPTDTDAWQKDINGQWTQGAIFLYESGNNPDSIIFWSRFPFIILTLILGWLLYRWTKKRFGYTAALLTLLLFAFSPTILAHGRYVTTDIGAALGFFIGITSFLAFLEQPSKRNLVLAGVAFGIAELLKFSLVLLVPIYIVLIIAWAWSQQYLHAHEIIKLFFKTLGKTMIIGCVGVAIIWGTYAVFTWNYPQERQIRDAETILASFGARSLANFDLALMKNRLTRPIGEYVLGVLMVTQRAAGGNTAYFLGEVSAAGSRLYFPLLYLVKESLPLHILTIIALVFGVRKILSRTRLNLGEKRIHLVRAWIRNHMAEFSSFAVIAVYWLVSLKSPLNIGVRHVLPTFPFIYLLVSKQISDWLRSYEYASPETWRGWFKHIYEIYIRAVPKFLFVILLMLWLVIDAFLVYPHYLSFYNGLGGGARNGYAIAADSNYDWGQDLKRLAFYVEKNNIQKIAVDYFGGGSPRYELGIRFEPWWSSRGPAHGYFAVSVTFLQNAFGEPAPGFIRKPEDSYEWLNGKAPVGRAGTSIFIYQLP